MVSKKKHYYSVRTIDMYNKYYLKSKVQVV